MTNFNAKQQQMCLVGAWIGEYSFATDIKMSATDWDVVNESNDVSLSASANELIRATFQYGIDEGVAACYHKMLSTA